MYESCTQNNLDRLQKMQNQATRIISGSNPESNPIWCEFMLCICFLPAVYYYVLCIYAWICRILCIHVHIDISSGWPPCQ